MGHCHAKQKMFRSVGLKIDEKQSVTFALFSTFLNPQRATLTYSALIKYTKQESVHCSESALNNLALEN